MPHVHPATDEEITTIGRGQADDVAAAVGAARRAFDDGPWGRMKARERRLALAPLVYSLRAHADELTELTAWTTACRSRSGEFCADVFDHYIGWIDKLVGETYPQFSDEVPIQFLSFREPIGVVAAIDPWNGPLLQFPLEVGPAPAAGCTVMVEPSEFASLAVLRVCELISELDLPPGCSTSSLAPGWRSATADHRPAGRQDRVHRQPGNRHQDRRGQCPNSRPDLAGARRQEPGHRFPDGHSVSRAATVVAGQTFYGLSGQACTAQTRALVHESAFDEFVTMVEDQARKVRHGNPFDPATNTGPIINPRQLELVSGFVDRGLAAGARAATTAADGRSTTSECSATSPPMMSNTRSTCTTARSNASVG